MSSNTLTGKSNFKLYFKSLKRCELFISSLCCLGILVSLYALQVEIYKSRDKNYSAYCDIGPFSCSKVFMSRYGKGFGLMPDDSMFNLPNSIYGLIFFIIQLLLLLFRNNAVSLQLKIFLSILANIGSVYLASILYYELKDFCLVCFSLYLVNAFLLFFNYKHYQYYKFLRGLNKKKRET